MAKALPACVLRIIITKLNSFCLQKDTDRKCVSYDMILSAIVYSSHH
jgi:hypothetical protein